MPSSSVMMEEDKQTIANSTAKKRLTASEKRLAQLRNKLALVQDKLRIHGSHRHHSSRQSGLTTTVSGSKRSTPLGGFHTDSHASSSSVSATGAGAAAAVTAAAAAGSGAVLKKSRRNSRGSRGSTHSDSSPGKITASKHPLTGPMTSDGISGGDSAMLNHQSSDASTIVSSGNNNNNDKNNHDSVGNSAAAAAAIGKSSSSSSSSSSQKSGARVLTEHEKAQLERKRVADEARAMKKACLKVWDRVCSAANSSPFKVPVSRDIAPDYPNFIKCPMDLSTVRSRLENDVYPTPYDFAYDMRLIFTNALYFNVGMTTKIGKSAFSVWQNFEKLFLKEVVNVFESAPLTRGMYRIMSMLMGQSFDVIGWFLYPVCPSKLNVPDYYDRIKEPMDFSYIWDRLHLYIRFGDVMNDVSKIWDNCLFYNGSEGTVPMACEKVRDQFLKRIHGEFQNESENWETGNPEWKDEFEPSQLRLSLSVPISPSPILNKPSKFFHPSPQYPNYGRPSTNSSNSIVVDNDTNNAERLPGHSDGMMDVEMADHSNNDLIGDDSEDPLSFSNNSDRRSALDTTINDNNVIDGSKDTMMMDVDDIADENEESSNLAAALHDAGDDEDHLMAEDVSDNPAARLAFMEKMAAKKAGDYRGLTELSFPQKQDLETGVAVLDEKHLDRVIDMLTPLAEDDAAEMELDVDSISPEMQVQLYCYLIEAVQDMLENPELMPAEDDSVDGEQEEQAEEVDEQQQQMDDEVEQDTVAVSDGVISEDASVRDDVQVVQPSEEDASRPTSLMMDDIEEDTPLGNSNDSSHHPIDSADHLIDEDSFALDMDDDEEEGQGGLGEPNDIAVEDQSGAQQPISNEQNVADSANVIEGPQQAHSSAVAGELDEQVTTGSDSTDETEEKNASMEASMEQSHQLFDDILGSESPVHEMDSYGGLETDVAITEQPQESAAEPSGSSDTQTLDAVSDLNTAESEGDAVPKQELVQDSLMVTQDSNPMPAVSEVDGS